jgi:hypothetical protein
LLHHHDGHGGNSGSAPQNPAKKAGRAIAHGAKIAQHQVIDATDTRDWLSITAIVIVYGLILLLLFK